MGDLREWSPEESIMDDKLIQLSPKSIGDDCWERAETVTQEIISHVQPTLDSEKSRKDVIDYVQRLIRDRLGCEVFPFGSVPLKTYLPDGDIDLTAFSCLNEDALACGVCTVLGEEDKNRAAMFEIKDVQLINAEVKLVKCLIQNIVVDISFNQLGGLCTLCFLEKVDRLIGRDHLFKRSIILIKAWCYYESRILGAHHGLISTYALETLVLYIFHLFHSSLSGPVGVLYKFLDYFSKFDWDNYCISLIGPICISSLPEIIAEVPENGGGDLLLRSEFLRECLEMFSVPSRASETISRTFLQKHLNIVDPLKDNNNLGRSVSKGNFYRIRSAFTYGARKLGRILSGKKESLAAEIPKFFANTLDRHGKGERPDVQDPDPWSEHNGIDPALPFSVIDGDRSISELDSADLRGISGECRLDTVEMLNDEVNEVNTSVVEIKLSRPVNDSRNSFIEVGSRSPKLSSGDAFHANGIAVTGDRLSGDAKDLATSRIQGLKISSNTLKSSCSKIEENKFDSPKARHSPHLYFSKSNAGSRETKYANPEQKQPLNSCFSDSIDSSKLLQVPDKEMHTILKAHQDEKLASSGEIQMLSGEAPLISGQVLCSLDEFHPAYIERTSVSMPGSPGARDFFSNLSGDYEGHLSSLNYGRWSYEYALSTSIQPVPPPFPSQIQSKDPWNNTRWQAPFRHNVFPHISANANGVVSGPAFYATMNPSMIPAAAFGMEEKPKPRGTGTYIPNTNHYRDRPSSGRGRNQAHARSPRNNGRAVMHLESNFHDSSNREMSSPRFTMHPGGGKARSLDHPYPDSPGRKSYPYANGSVLPSERGAELGSFGHVPTELPSQAMRPAHPDPSYDQNSSPRLPPPGLQRPKAISVIDQDGVILKSFRLKDEDDFPPLSS